jgi:hypothetical protein
LAFYLYELKEMGIEAERELLFFASGRLGRKDNTLCVELEEGTKYYPVETVGDIYVLGEVDKNKNAWNFSHKKKYCYTSLITMVIMWAVFILANTITRGT